MAPASNQIERHSYGTPIEIIEIVVDDIHADVPTILPDLSYLNSGWIVRCRPECAYCSDVLNK